MDGIIKYCIVKKYKGLFRRHPSNTHLFFIPVDPKKYMYLALIGKMTDEDDNLYASQLLVKLSEDIFEETLNGEIEYFGNRFVEVETLKCKSHNPSPGKYIINIPQKGYNIKSDIELDYQIEFSTVQRRIYTFKADLNLVTGEVNQQDMKMVAAKQIAFIGGIKRFNEMKKINKDNFIQS